VPALSYPYESLAAPFVPWLLVILVLAGVAWVGQAWLLPGRREEPGALTAVALAALLLLIARWRLAPESAAAVGLVLAAHAIALYSLARHDWPVPGSEAPRAPSGPGSRLS
jgi:hypothetical protein